MHAPKYSPTREDAAPFGTIDHSSISLRVPRNLFLDLWSHLITDLTLRLVRILFHRDKAIRTQISHLNKDSPTLSSEAYLPLLLRLSKASNLVM